jgi:hypothetical protein
MRQRIFESRGSADPLFLFALACASSPARMLLKETKRFRDGKEHHCWSRVENRRVDAGRKVVQRHVL